jgi:4-hydroxy-tetrahydrodipicolinate reductase
MGTPIRVAIAGATGRTGRAVALGIADVPDMQVVGAVGQRHAGQMLGQVLGVPALSVPIVDHVDKLAALMPDVLVDFTEAHSALPRLVEAARRGWSLVVGTTGFTEEEQATLAREVVRHTVGCALIANFSIGAWVADQLAAAAAAYLSEAEIIEAHHATKRDRPSGTARRTQGVLAQKWHREPDSIPIHSVRLTGLVAHQATVFGAPGQVLTIRHDVHDRSAYVAGVVAAIRGIERYRGTVVTDLGVFLRQAAE